MSAELTNDELHFEYQRSPQYNKRHIPGGTRDENLFQCLEYYRKNRWLFPEHQRDPVWSATKISAFAETLRTSSAAPGTIVTYQVGGDGPIFINDGQQRIRAAQIFEANPKRFGVSVEEAHDILTSFSMTIQHWHYPDHKTARIWFRRLNSGAVLTAREYYVCDLVDTLEPNYAALWIPIFNELHRICDEAHNRVARLPMDREHAHPLRRHDLLLLYRQLCPENTPVSYRVGDRGPKPSKNPSLESRLAPVLQKLGAAAITETLTRSFAPRLQRNVALISECISSTIAESHRVLRSRDARWLMDFLTWASLAEFPLDLLRTYCVSFIRHQEGQVMTAEGREKLRVALGDLSAVTHHFKQLGLEWPADRPQRKIRPRLQPGFDWSHIKPFASHGEGPAVVELALTNRARGAKPIS